MGRCTRSRGIAPLRGRREVHCAWQGGAHAPAGLDPRRCPSHELFEPAFALLAQRMTPKIVESENNCCEPQEEPQEEPQKVKREKKGSLLTSRCLQWRRLPRPARSTSGPSSSSGGPGRS